MQNQTNSVASSCSDIVPIGTIPCPGEIKNICTDVGLGGNVTALAFFFNGMRIVIPVPFKIIKVKRLLYKHGMTVNQAITTIQQMLS